MLRSVFATSTHNVQQAVRFLSHEKLLKLNDLSHIPGSVKMKRRWGRGTGSGRGKLCGYGHQKSLSTPAGFEGGQTPLYKRLPKIGFHNPNAKEFTAVNLRTVQEFIEKGKLVPQPNKMITMRDLVLAGIISEVGDGITLLADGKEELKAPIHIEVSRASSEAIKTVESLGGTVTCSHFNELALRALLKPYKFDILPQRARPTPKQMQYYLDQSKCGYLSPEIQARNLKLFGYVTSETPLREEHDSFMAFRRAQWAVERQKKIEYFNAKAEAEAAKANNSA